MKTRLLTSVTILAIASLLQSANVLAQRYQGNDDSMSAPPSAAEKLARISEALDLSDDQAVQLLVVLQEKKEQGQVLHEEIMLLMGPQICALKSDTEKAILSILTPDQAELFLLHKEGRSSKANQGPKGRNMGSLDCSQYEEVDG